MRRSHRSEFEEFARSRTGELRRAALLLTGERHAADDLVQEALTRIYTRWHRVRDAENPVGYARTVLVRLYVDEKRRRRSQELPVAAPPDAAADGEVDVDLRHGLIAALRELAPLDRAVVVQRYLLDQDVATVAADLRITGQAVRSRSSRALARLRDQLGDGFLALHTTEEGQR